MNDDNKTIHDFDFSLICEYFSMLERQGPGSKDTTIKALGFTGNLNSGSRIADIGCGTGGQTMVLAGNAPGQITGIDLFPDFIDIFNRNAMSQGLGSRVKGIVGNMEKLPFEKEELDLIWSEGAIYNIGYERGLNEWRRYLKPGAYIAVSEASWFTAARPTEIEEFWNTAYPEIDTIPAKVRIMQDAGFIPVAAFILPDYCWTDNFYVPQAEAREVFLKKHTGNKAVVEFIESERREESLYMKYREYYGYAFYIGRKI
ncbi:MAG: methyltransferase domain-containing protein [Bacteroidales bacterium]|nr:methyltransferase domain-containing protein [Bacteroidales bacterium]